jgi:hypothetical protein
MNPVNGEENDAEKMSLEIQKIIKNEIETLRELLSLLLLEEKLTTETTTESKKVLLRQRSEVYKKLRHIKKEKESLFETFFFETFNDYEVSTLKEHLDSIQGEVNRKQYVSKKSLKSPTPLLKPSFKKTSTPKTTITTIDASEESLN